MSSSGDTAIAIRGLSKAYTILHDLEKVSPLRETLRSRLRRPFRRVERETYWALRDVSLEIKQGEVVGLIGRNGAGKSTLLKILSRISEPTAGRIDLFGRVGSLLEVGTGFHPELTGRENIFLNGAILGMSRREISREFDAIVDFAGVERFLDTPVKRYSSGMYVRLAFAVAAHLQPEILIVDEVLAVGDAAFQRKCLGKMEDVAKQGRTVLFVSHNMVAVQNLCNRCLVVQDGRIYFDGDTGEAISQYLCALQPGGLETTPGEYDLTNRVNPDMPGKLILRKATIINARGHITDKLPMGEAMTVVLDVEGMSEYRDNVVGFLIKTENEETVAGFSSRMRPIQASYPRQTREQLVIRIPSLPLTPNTYWMVIGIKEGKRKLDYIERAAHFDVVENDVYGTGYRFARGEGLVFLDASIEACSDVGACTPG